MKRIPRSSYLHISCEARMVLNPIDPMLPPLPWIQKPGVTYDIGRNKAKRERRARRFS